MGNSSEFGDLDTAGFETVEASRRSSFEGKCPNEPDILAAWVCMCLVFA
jgi:hypothetical protein